jgi:hypothetical protein
VDSCRLFLSPITSARFPTYETRADDDGNRHRPAPSPALTRSIVFCSVQAHFAERAPRVLDHAPAPAARQLPLWPEAALAQHKIRRDKSQMTGPRKSTNTTLFHEARLSSWFTNSTQ